jgi:hypothetical protein
MKWIAGYLAVRCIAWLGLLRCLRDALDDPSDRLAMVGEESRLDRPKGLQRLWAKPELNVSQVLRLLDAYDVTLRLLGRRSFAPSESVGRRGNDDSA